MEKKGISPLIATVLILGFTVALAAMIMTWGTGFTRQMQEQTEETSNIQVTCATDVAFDVKSVCETAVDGVYKITIANNGNLNIDSFMVRYYESAGDATQQSVPFSGGIPKFGIESDETVTSGQTSVKMIEAIPVITVGGKSITCSSNIDSFGSLESSVIAAC